MKKSIETIWRESFAESENFIYPQPKNYQKLQSKHLIDKIKKMFKINLLSILVSAILFLIIFYYLQALWQGVCAAVLLAGLAVYSYFQMKQLETIDQGLNSYEYLKKFDHFLKTALTKNEKVMRIFYPLIFLTAVCVVWFAGDNKAFLTSKLREHFPDLLFVGDIPLMGLIITGIIALLFFYFSNKIYNWDVKLVYGRIFKKLEESIAEMEKLNL